MKSIWTVYTVVELVGGYDIVATKWTDDGPQDSVVKATLRDVTLAEAQAQAQEMQASYDRVRGAIVS